MSEWKEFTLGEIGTIARGKSKHRPRDAAFLYGGKYPFIQTGDIKSANHRVLNYSQTYSDEGLKQSKLWPKGTICITIAANIADTAILNFPACFPDSVIGFTANKNICNVDFIEYLLQFYKLQIKTHSIGSVQDNINLGTFEKIKFKIPDLPTQTVIAEILSSLDDKIELNNKINLELEQLAQTLFKQWFIDFEFPNVNGEPYKSSGGEMVESELGEIPKGWEVKNLDEISNITIGRTPPRQEHHWFSENPNDVKWISIKDMGNCGTYISETSEYLTEEAVTKFKIPTIEKNTVIISFKLTVGRISITTERMLSNEAIAHINLINKELSPEFIYLYLKQFDFDSLGSTSSIATAVNSKSIKAIKIYKPSKDVLKLFQLQVEALFQQLFNNTFEKRELTNLRDTLLPKLISGELAVSSL